MAARAKGAASTTRPIGGSAGLLDRPPQALPAGALAVQPEQNSNSFWPRRNFAKKSLAPLENHESKTFIDRRAIRRFESPREEDLMTRGSLASLSANEEVTLRRVALGITKAANLSELDIKRLRALSLIEENAGGLRLTPIGRERYLALPKSAAVDQADSPDDPVAKLAAYMTKARG
jgi:hypothetical protein